ncbi:MAG: hypothetical protein OEX07_15960, partial [Gammaproteobacteria bacterium]|nr:hypothetical protein [Gammaproteobacteria bacterium]
DNFKSEYEKSIQTELTARGMHFMGSTSVSAQTAWDLYQNSQKVALGFHLFGRHVSNEERWNAEGGIDLASKQPGALGQIEHPTAPGRNMSAMEVNFGLVNDSTDGSILMMGGQNWNLHVNDAWLMGGVHAYLPFYSASKLTKENLFRGEGASTVLGITGREFFGLLLAGYKVEKGHDSLGLVMVCKDKARADRLDFSLYEQSVQLVESQKSRQTVIDMASDAGVTLI